MTGARHQDLVAILRCQISVDGSRPTYMENEVNF